MEKVFFSAPIPKRTHKQRLGTGLSISFDMRLWAIKFDTNAGHPLGPQMPDFEGNGTGNGNGNGPGNGVLAKALLICRRY